MNNVLIAALRLVNALLAVFIPGVILLTAAYFLAAGPETDLRLVLTGMGFSVAIIPIVASCLIFISLLISGTVAVLLDMMDSARRQADNAQYAVLVDHSAEGAASLGYQVRTMRVRRKGASWPALLMAGCFVAAILGGTALGTFSRRAELAAEGRPENIGLRDVSGTQDDLAANIGDRVFFDSRKADLSSGAVRTLQKQAAWLMKYPKLRVTISGHTDDQEAGKIADENDTGCDDDDGGPGKNKVPAASIDLGKKRAIAVEAFLVKAGIERSRISSQSYGYCRATALGDSEQAWAQNRSAIISVQPPLASPPHPP